MTPASAGAWPQQCKSRRPVKRGTLDVLPKALNVIPARQGVSEKARKVPVPPPCKVISALPPLQASGITPGGEIQDGTFCLLIESNRKLGRWPL